MRAAKQIHNPPRNRAQGSLRAGFSVVTDCTSMPSQRNIRYIHIIRYRRRDKNFRGARLLSFPWRKVYARRA